MTGDEQRGILLCKTLGGDVRLKLFHAGVARVAESVQFGFYVGYGILNGGASTKDSRDDILAVDRLYAPCKHHCSAGDLFCTLEKVVHDIRKAKLIQAVFRQAPGMFSDGGFTVCSQDQGHDGQVQIRRIVGILIVQVGPVPDRRDRIRAECHTEAHRFGRL